LAIAVAVTSLAMLGHSFSQTIPVLFIFRILHGAAFGISSTVNIAMASMYIPRSRLGEGLSLFGIALIIARAISPNVGLIVSDSIGLNYCFIIAALIQAVAFILIMFFPYVPEPKTNNPKMATGFSIKSIIATEGLIFAVLGGCFTMLNGIMNSFLVLYADSLSIKGIGLYFTVNAGVVILCRLSVGKLIDRISMKYIVYPTLGAVIISVICVATARSIWMILIAAVFYGIGQGTGQPALQSSCIKQVGPERRGVATSTFYLGADVGQGIGPTIGGSISQHYGYTSMYALSTIPLALGMLLFALYSKFKKNKDSKNQNKVEAGTAI
jgi:MFS family permease